MKSESSANFRPGKTISRQTNLTRAPSPAKMVGEMVEWVGLRITLLSALLLCACVKHEQPKQDFGPESDPQEILNTIKKVRSSSNPFSMKVGEFVHLEENQTVANTVHSITADTGITVTNREENDVAVRYSFTQRRFTYYEQKPREVATELPPLVLKKPQKSSSSIADMIFSFGISVTPSPNPLAPSPLSGPQTHLTMSASEPSQVTFHNFKFSEQTEPAPDLVAQRPDCLNIEGCKYKVSRISFDEVAWINNQPELTQYSYAFSDRVPYIASQLENCATRMVELSSGSKAPVKFCSVVRDFKSGN